MLTVVVVGYHFEKHETLPKRMHVKAPNEKGLLTVVCKATRCIKIKHFLVLFHVQHLLVVLF